MAWYNPSVNKLPIAALAVVVILLVELITLSTLPLRLNPAAFRFPPVMLPLALINPVMYAPVVANTATFDVPPIPMATLPPELTTRTFDVPFCIEVASIPVSKLPLPKK